MSLKDAIREAADERDKQGAPLLTPPQPAPPARAIAEPKVSQVELAASQQTSGTNSQAVNTASHKAVKTSRKKPTEAQGERTRPETHNEETAAMTVRVSRRHRLHWLICAKQEGTSLTAAITEALNARFGEPSGSAETAPKS